MFKMIANLALTVVSVYLANEFSGLLAGIVAGFIAFGVLMLINRDSQNANF